ncbi:UDP-glucose 4-epimerase [Pirellulimonas nuda]|uniref:UDP-glucose 4-epimerase n=1 Tax=Pirellulimonas nuda TaxID=2528009 RepID=A0A518D6Y9_9BACT|nr:NAD-dependent epimerase/dehydratase family protein [Pirellulimonas nuda]QDU87237.1 UDP-glucose 4-epimerase [Pirellulimonas nuda]
MPSPTAQPTPRATDARRVLVTGAAGFIGMHVCQRLLAAGHTVLGVDNLNDYYDVRLKQARLAQLEGSPGFEFRKLELADADQTSRLFAEPFGSVVHLAAQAGVRYSLENPSAYVQSNLVAFGHILEGCRRQREAHGDAFGHLVYASSSSVYGGAKKTPFAVGDPVDHPYSLYAATKKANELMAHTYSHLYALPTTGLRFFTVYGPWGRPDMAIYKFSELMRAGSPIDVYNHGVMRRDFTYIDDIVEGVLRVLASPPRPGERRPSDGQSPLPTAAPYRLYNIGHNHPEELETVITTLEAELGIKAIRNPLPMQPGDVPETYADIDALSADFGYRPEVGLGEGVRRFVVWWGGMR